MVGNVCRVKQFTTGLQMFCWWQRGWNEGAEVAETTVKRLLCCGFRCTGKAMGLVYQCRWRIWWEINVFSTFIYHMFYVLYSFVTYLLTLPCNNCTYCGQSHPKGKLAAYDKRVNNFWSIVRIGHYRNLHSKQKRKWRWMQSCLKWMTVICSAGNWNLEVLIQGWFPSDKPPVSLSELISVDVMLNTYTNENLNVVTKCYVKHIVKGQVRVLEFYVAHHLITGAILGWSSCLLLQPIKLTISVNNIQKEHLKNMLFWRHRRISFSVPYNLNGRCASSYWITLGGYLLILWSHWS
jgi:hypothetical protein